MNSDDNWNNENVKEERMSMEGIRDENGQIYRKQTFNNKKPAPEGLKASIFQAIQGDERVSMAAKPSPVKCAVTRTNSMISRLTRATTTRSASTSSAISTEKVSFNNISINREKSFSSSIIKSKPASMENINTTMTIPTIKVTPAEPELQGVRSGRKELPRQGPMLMKCLDLCPTQGDGPTPGINEKVVKKAPLSWEVKNVDKKLGVEWIRNCRNGNIDKIREMLKDHPDIVNYAPPYFYNETALHIAVRGKFAELIQVLRESGADLNHRTSAGSTALHIAAQQHDKQMVKFLIKLGVNEDIFNHAGHTYHYYAPWISHDEHVAFLFRGRHKTDDSRPPSQCSLETPDQPFSRNNSFRSTIKRFVSRRSPSPA